MTDANGLIGDRYTRVVIPPMDTSAWQTGAVQVGPLEDCHGWIAAAEACTEVGADEDGFGAIEGLLAWPALVALSVVVLAVVSAIFWPY